MRARLGIAADGALRTAMLVLATGLLAGAALIAGFESNRFSLLLTIGILAGMLGFVLAANHRLFCLYGLIVLAPIALSKNFFLWLHMGGASSITLDAIDPALLMLLGFQMRDVAAGRVRWRLTPMAKWVIALMALGVLDMVLGPKRFLPGLEVIRMAKCLLLFLVIVNEVVRERQMMHLLVALLASIAVQSTLGIAQGVFKVSLGLQALGEADFQTIKNAARGTYLIDGPSSGFRSNALLGHPNLLSIFLAMQLPICIALMFSRLSALQRGLIAAVTMLGSAALLMTLSRSGWLSFGVAAVLLFALSFVHPRLQRRYLFARVAAIVFMLIVASAFAGEIIKRITESDPGALNFRLEWNSVAWGMVAERPFLGFGLNTFVLQLPGRTQHGGVTGLTNWIGEHWPVVHNIYLLTWSEQGTLGFAIFIGMFCSIFAAAIRNIRRYYSDVMFAVNLGALCGIVALCIDGLASFYLRTPAPSRMFWVIAALIFVVDHWNQVNAPQPHPSAPAPRAPTPAPPRPAPARSAPHGPADAPAAAG